MVDQHVVGQELENEKMKNVRKEIKKNALRKQSISSGGSI